MNKTHTKTIVWIENAFGIPQAFNALKSIPCESCAAPLRENDEPFAPLCESCYDAKTKNLQIIKYYRDNHTI